MTRSPTPPPTSPPPPPPLPNRLQHHKSGTPHVHYEGSHSTLPQQHYHRHDTTFNATITRHPLPTPHKHHSTAHHGCHHTSPRPLPLHIPGTSRKTKTNKKISNLTTLKETCTKKCVPRKTFVELRTLLKPGRLRVLVECKQSHAACLVYRWKVNNARTIP